MCAAKCLGLRLVHDSISPGGDLVVVCQELHLNHSKANIHLNKRARQSGTDARVRLRVCLIDGAIGIGIAILYDVGNLLTPLGWGDELATATTTHALPDPFRKCLDFLS